MSEFEPDHIRAINDSEQEFSADLRPRLRQHVVFDNALDVMQNLAAETVEREHLHEYWSDTSSIIRDLNKEVEQGGLVGEVVIIEGKNIEIPEVSIDLAGDVTKVTMLDDEDRAEKALQTTLNPSAIKGNFRGFCLKFKETSESNVYTPTLSYKVETGRFHTPNTEVTVYATGSVGTTNLEFESDVKLDELQGILETLYWLAPESAKTINTINVSLSGMQLDASCMRHVSYHADKITDSVRDESKKVAVEDAISDLVRHYIDMSSTYVLQSPVYVKSQSAVKQNEKALITSNANHAVFHKKIKDIVFMNFLDYTRNGIKVQEERSLHFVVGDVNGTDYLYVPLQNLSDFRQK